jgi:N-carbamoyl-D-amino-acid hydrolase
MRVAAMQLGPASSTIAATTSRILALLEQAQTAGVEIAVFPELALTPYFAAQVHESLSAWTDVAENEAALDAIRKKGKAAGMTIVLPYAEETNAGLYNSMAFLDKQGKKVGTFRKMHIPGQVEPKPDAEMTILEKRYFQPGDLGFAVYDMGAAKLGGLICYDRRFPESYRSLAFNGAEIIAVSYNTPVMNGGTLRAGRHASQLAITAGAYYTGTAVIAAGKAGTENGVRYIGASFVAGPDGQVLAKARTNGDEMVLAELDLEKQAKIRDRWAFTKNQRPDDYVTREQA